MMTRDQQQRLKAAYAEFSRRAEEVDPEGKVAVDRFLRLIEGKAEAGGGVRSTLSAGGGGGMPSTGGGAAMLSSGTEAVAPTDDGPHEEADVEAVDLADVPELFGAWRGIRDELTEDVATPAHGAVSLATAGPAEEHLASHHLPPEAEAEEIEVLDDGGLLGSGTYQILDPHWIEAGIHWLTHIFDRVDFNPAAPVVRIPNETSLALVGDWGTGPYAESCGAPKVRDQIESLGVDYTVHLGDVYYAGTKKEVEENFLPLWPVGRRGSFALNSNHEMYDGGRGLFEVTLRHRAFEAQQQATFFALENDHWVLVGLDSAYHANRYRLYRTGKLDDVQLDFLRQRVADLGDRRLLLMSHHQGLELSGEPSKRLWKQVQGALAGTPAIWYWGHVHSAVVYRQREGIQGRCNGHGGIPRGRAKVLENNPHILWFEGANAEDPAVPPRVVNGLAHLELDGREIRETFLDERGQSLWSSHGEDDET